MTETGASHSMSFRTFFVVACLATMTITLLRFEVIDLPPYWDSAMGVWAQANAIVDSEFSIRLHLFEERHFLLGGYSVYRPSVVPWLVAGLMSVMDPPGAFVAYHLLIFTMAGCTFALLYVLLAAQVSKPHAALVTFAAFAVPVFNVQIDQLGLEMFLSVFVLLTAHCLFHERFLSASLIAGSSFLMKQTGFLITFALVCHFAFSILVLSADSRESRLRRLLLPFAISCGAFYLQMRIMSIDILYPGAFFGLQPSIILSMALWYPGILISLLIAVSSLAKWLGQLPGPEIEPVWQKRLGVVGIAFDIARHIVIYHPVVLYSWIVVLGVGFGMLTLTAAIPRYIAFAVPMLYFVIGFQTSQFAHRKPWDVAIFCLLAYDLLNWSGHLLPSAEFAQSLDQECTGSHVSREGSILERSHEYLPDLRATIAAASAIEREHKNDPVIVGLPFAHFLTMPRLGYVKEPIKGYLSGWVTDDFRTLASLQQLLLDAPLRPVFVRQPTTLYLHWSKIAMPPPASTDEIVYSDGRDPPLVAYRKRLDRLGYTPQTVDQWYRDHFIGLDLPGPTSGSATQEP